MTAKLNAGQEVDGLEIVDALGAGGMSAVYRARDRQTGKLVVLKVPHPGLIGDPSTFTRFQREVEVGRRLQHPGVARVLGTGRLDGGFTPYVVVEYVEGQSLRDLLASDAPLPVDRAVDIIRQLAGALAYCHEQGVVHRDLKPENVVLAPNGQLKIMDFGIALLPGARRVTWGPLSSTVGTPDYMAPEQVRGQRGDERTDVYALGVMFYEMLIGETPFQGDNPLAILSQRVSRDPPRIRSARPEVSPALDAIVARALQRDPPNRYPTMAAFADDLDHPDRVDLSPKVAPRKKAGARWSHVPAWLVVAVTLLVLGLLGLAAEMAHRAAGLP